MTDKHFGNIRNKFQWFKVVYIIIINIHLGHHNGRYGAAGHHYGHSGMIHRHEFHPGGVHHGGSHHGYGKKKHNIYIHKNLISQFKIYYEYKFLIITAIYIFLSLSFYNLRINKSWDYY